MQREPSILLKVSDSQNRSRHTGPLGGSEGPNRWSPKRGRPNKARALQIKKTIPGPSDLIRAPKMYISGIRVLGTQISTLELQTLRSIQGPTFVSFVFFTIVRENGVKFKKR